MRAQGYLGLMSLILLLLGCSASGENDLRQWMAQQQNQTRLRVALLTEPKDFSLKVIPSLPRWRLSAAKN